MNNISINTYIINNKLNAKHNYLAYNFDKISFILHFGSFLKMFVLIMNKTLCSECVQHYV